MDRDPNLWGGIVGAPGTLKSPALQEVLRPLEILEKEAREAFLKEEKDFLLEMDMYKASKEALQKRFAKATVDQDTMLQAAIKQQLTGLQEPKAPLSKRYSVNDATVEKLHELLSQNSRGLLLFRDELMGLFETWDRKGHEGDRSFYLEAWNGYGSKTTDRIQRGTLHAKTLCLSILGTTQPSKLSFYFARTLEGLESDGLLQRFQLLVYPDEPPVWTLIDREPNLSAQEHVSLLMRTLATMDFVRYGAVLEENSDLPHFRLDAEAQGLFYDWLTALERERRQSTDDPLLIESLAKQRKLVPALALVFHLIDLAAGKSPSPITAQCLKQALIWCKYLESHMRRIYEISTSSNTPAARHLAKKNPGRRAQESF